MGAVNTTYTFTATDTITSSKMNNIIDQTTITTDAIIGTTLDIASGKLKIRASGITSNEMGANSVVAAAIKDSNVTTAKIADASVIEAKLAVGARIPAGAIMAFAMNTAPTGWALAHGGYVSTTGTYAALFAAIGYTYGGSNALFRLPDLRGYFVRGSGTNSDGTESGTFGEKQADEFKAHNHTVGKGASGGGNYVQNGQSTGDALTTGLTGGNETRPKNIAMLYCIKL